MSHAIFSCELGLVSVFVSVRLSFQIIYVCVFYLCISFIYVLLCQTQQSQLSGAETSGFSFCRPPFRLFSTVAPVALVLRSDFMLYSALRKYNLF